MLSGLRPTAHPAADAKTGNLNLGVTKERLQDGGRFPAKMTHFPLADVNYDGLTDVGVIQEEISCGPEDSYGEPGPPFYEQRRVHWYVYTSNVWSEDTNHVTKFPERFAELPLLGIQMGPVDDVANVIWGNSDPPSGRRKTDKLRSLCLGTDKS